MKRYICVLLLFVSILFLSANPACAQGNGSFTGKRVLFNLSATFSPAWFNPNFFNNSKHWEKYYAFNYMLTPSMEVIAWRYGTIGTHYHWFETKCNYFVNLLEWWNTYSEVAPMTVHGVGCFYKQYFGENSRAPLGWYAKIQGDILFARANIWQPDIIEQETYSGTYFTYSETEGQTVDVQKIVGSLAFEIGYDFLFFDRLRINTAFFAGLPLCKWKLSEHEGSSQSLTYEESVARRLIMHYALGMKMSIGFLAF
ncbi:MAG: hypothetical protein LBR51_05575 [Bacteroidales bacterium]|jgi:hypothetical protein|nr:hypothetical protein [Bacteroidales bacterium]